eukprot:3441910-Amphidinium_carterae.2
MADDSPIRWKVKLSSRSKASRNCEALVDPGAHGSFLTTQIANRLNLAITPLPAGSGAKLPDGTLIPLQGETEPITLTVGRQFKCDMKFKVLDLTGIDVILGIPFLHHHAVKLDFSDKTAHLKHRNRDLCIHPANPVHHINLQGDPIWDLIQRTTDSSTKTHIVRFNPSLGPQKPQPKTKQIRKQIKGIRKSLSSEYFRTLRSTRKEGDVSFQQCGCTWEWSTFPPRGVYKFLVFWTYVVNLAEATLTMGLEFFGTQPQQEFFF